MIICWLVDKCPAFRSARVTFPSWISPGRPATPRPFRPSRPLGSAVTVWDAVIDDDACRHLHELTLESTQRSRDGSFVFQRGALKSERLSLTPIETAIDDVLTALNDTSSWVEYWSRRDYLNLGAHADVDEDQLRDDGVLRCPQFGHVLYLDVSRDHGGRAARPTVVFPGRQVAWGPVAPCVSPSSSAASYNSRENLEERGALEYTAIPENAWDEEQGQLHGHGNDEREGGTDVMVVVPARNGRLLRFPGAAFHAVPRPPERYLLDAAELAAVDDAEREEEDEWDDDISEANLRSVLLFNTWSGAGPRGVGLDRADDVVPDGIALPGDGASASSGADDRRRRWRDAHGEDYERVRPSPFARWTAVDATPVDAHVAAISVSLMGNRARRGCTATEAVLHGPVTASVFHDDHRVSSVTLERKQE